MGLDITAYKNLTAHPVTEDSEDREVYLYINPDFPSQADGLLPVDEADYTAEDSFGFRAGSYGGYSAWREKLAKIAGYPARTYRDFNNGEVLSHAAGAWEAESGPFHELINFSDCEGVIGPQTSAKLLLDFIAFQAQADADEDEYFKERYENWRKAFEMASQNGAVAFH